MPILLFNNFNKKHEIWNHINPEFIQRIILAKPLSCLEYIGGPIHEYKLLLIGGLSDGSKLNFVFI